jgi:inner membrane protein
MEDYTGQQECHDPPPPRHKPKTDFCEANKLLIKGIIIGLLILIMLIPSAFITNLVHERADRQQEVIAEVSRKWAEPQTLVGPVLMLPYNVYSVNGKGETVTTKNVAYFLPDKLDINGELKPENRHRSIYEVMVYRSDVTLSGTFDQLNLASLNIKPEDVSWNEARLVMGVNDTRGLEDEIPVRWNNSNLKLESGTPENNVLPAGLSTLVACTPAAAATFSINLKIKGSEYFYFTPVGKVTSVNIKSPWKNPAFDGKYLPSVGPAISDKGFNAIWKIRQASRSYPQAWTNSSQKFSESSFGVRLIQPTDSYAKTERSVKYALLFISLTFTVFFFIELLQKKQIHPLQYFLVGIALSVFYTLLLSFSEYMGFNIAYAVAASATIMLIGSYVWSIFRQAQIALGFTLALGSLYAYIFFLIQLQDYALLFGSVGLFVVVALVMYSSRKVDWYRVGKKQPLQPS